MPRLAGLWALSWMLQRLWMEVMGAALQAPNLCRLTTQPRLPCPAPTSCQVGIRFRLVECPAPGSIVADIDTYRAGGEWVLDVGEGSKSRPSLGLCWLHPQSAGSSPCSTRQAGILHKHPLLGPVLCSSNRAPTAGGYIRLSLTNVAGTGALESIELRKPPMAVSAAWELGLSTLGVVHCI